MDSKILTETPKKGLKTFAVTMEVGIMVDAENVESARPGCREHRPVDREFRNTQLRR